MILSELPGCCARRGRRRPTPVSIPAIGILARRAVPDLPDRQRHFAGGPLSPRSRRDPLEPLRQRLKDQGRLKPKQIVAAAMRKLLHLCFGVLKTGKPFDPEHTNSTEEAASTV